jgi:hypothetical protein
MAEGLLMIRSEMMHLFFAALVGVAMVSCQKPNGPEPGQIGATVERDNWRIDFVEVAGWEDRMPAIDPGPDWPRRYLVLTLHVHNLQDAELALTVDQVRLSFDPDDFGRPASGIVVVDDHQQPIGETIRIPAQAREHTITLRGENVFEQDREGATIYVTVDLTADGKTRQVRQTGEIMITH